MCSCQQFTHTYELKNNIQPGHWLGTTMSSIAHTNWIVANPKIAETGFSLRPSQLNLFWVKRCMEKYNLLFYLFDFTHFCFDIWSNKLFFILENSRKDWRSSLIYLWVPCTFFGLFCFRYFTAYLIYGFLLWNATPVYNTFFSFLKKIKIKNMYALF